MDHVNFDQYLLHCSVTNLECQEFFPLGHQIEVNPCPCPGESDATDKQNSQNQIGEGSCYIYNLKKKSEVLWYTLFSLSYHKQFDWSK